MTHSNKMTPANDEHDAVALLVAAHRVSADPVTRQYIELALVHEGRKISGSLSPSEKANGLDRTGT